MKKLKFLLLWWIITLLSIGSFSNAWYEFVKNITFGSCNQYSSIASLGVIDSPWLYKVVVTDSWWRSIQYAQFKCPNDWNKFRINWSNNFIFDYWWTAQCSFYLANSSFYWEGCPSAVLYKNVPVFDFWGNSALSPAITWVKDVAFQMIPFVIYVVIWLLVCSIWFVVIRWLLSWLWLKIKSIFSSKLD